MQHDPQPLCLSLELRPCGAALAGSLRDERGEEHAFTGWLGLITLLEAARVRAEPMSMVA